ncbi:alkaline-phosphatase-like protein [Lipomyces tetrasporus]|uniref:GPI ethanolamine phosphate transferase 2 n=1 Tax=Lipomyces tetrasporus TaxID=54092 RepID=A0AAD7VTB1_9ASCO|nr:alkaline-phosphatase-like protein [Lipomyces tetrasporus]KAJ8099970.1 alkaline-phosphatase-like protein [Lipomyces tetrasporus]
MVPKGLIVAVLLPLECLGLLFFARGFFPYKPVFHGYAPVDPDAPPAVSEKVIFMLVDALRSDFVFSNESSMTFTQSLISSGNAIPFTARAAPPTVTLPRIKGVTTGSVSNFLDAVLNIAESDSSSSLVGQDSWLLEFKRRPVPGKLVMFGDDTWLKLFPGVFDRYDGTSSFFVSDFTEVDNNVTRHLEAELKTSDWDVMILHYLGVDHIGHKGGPHSPFMPDKQKEMDRIVEMLYGYAEKQATEGESTLLVLCGDHGMNEIGNHGGSSAGEVAAALLFASPLFSMHGAGLPAALKRTDNYEYYNVIEQVDIVPSISGLVGNPFPMNSIGIFIPELLRFWSRSDQIKLLRQNAEQMYRILKEAFSTIGTPVTDVQALLAGDDIDKIRGLWDQIEKPHFVESDSPVETLYAFLRLGQNLLSRTSSNYDISSMFVGLGLVSWLSLLAFRRALLSTPEDIVTKVAFAVGIIAHAITMFGSSLVEEEHYFWYWFASAWIMAQTIMSSRRRSRTTAVILISLLAVLSILRHYHHTGQKYAGSYDIAQFLSTDVAAGLLWFFIVLEHLLIFKNLHYYVFADVSPLIAFVCSFTPVISLFSFKMSMALESGEVVPPALVAITPTSTGAGQLLNRAKTCFLSIIVCMIFHTLSTMWNTKKDPFKFIRGTFHIVVLLLVVQTRSINIPIFVLYEIVHSLSRRFAAQHQATTPLAIVLSTLIWQRVSFFAAGNSNSLATVDLSNAYNGVSGYSVIPVGILTFISNFSGPIFFTLSGIVQLSIWKNASSSTRSLEDIFTVDFLSLIHACHAVSLMAVMGACMALRAHLFIWTVFSPKLLYAVGWFLLQQGAVDTIFGLLIVVVSDLL